MVREGLQLAASCELEAIDAFENVKEATDPLPLLHTIQNM